MNQKNAIPTQYEKLFPHFGKTPQVSIVDVTGNSVVDKQVLTFPEHSNGSMPTFLHELGVTDALCGDLGIGAVKMLGEMGVHVHGGALAIGMHDIAGMFLAGNIVYGDSACHHEACSKWHDKLSALKLYCALIKA